MASKAQIRPFTVYIVAGQVNGFTEQPIMAIYITNAVCLARLQAST